MEDERRKNALSKASLSLPRFSRSPSLFHNVVQRASIQNFTKIRPNGLATDTSQTDVVSTYTYGVLSYFVQNTSGYCRKASDIFSRSFGLPNISRCARGLIAMCERYDRDVREVWSRCARGLIAMCERFDRDVREVWHRGSRR